MTLIELSKLVSKQLDIKHDDVKKVAECLFKEIGDCIIKNQTDVRIKNFGTFYLGKTPKKKTKHPKTGENINIEDGRTIRLKIATNVKKQIKREVKAVG